MGVLLLNLVKWLAGLAIPAALAMFVPRRWLVAALATWSLLPLPVFLVLLIEESLRGPPEVPEPGIGVVLLFYGGIVAVPWFVMSAMGAAVGLALRRRRASALSVMALPAVSAVPPPQDVPIQPAPPPPPSQWRARHIGFERDGLILDGLDVWGSEWHRLGATTVELPHPAHPHELHRFRIFEAGDAPQARQFAAIELSNGVWGFYTPIGTDAPRAGTSTDGKPTTEAAARRSSAQAPRAARTPRRVGPRQLLVALAILIGGLGAIGAISSVVVRLGEEPPPKLSTVPEMPH